MSLRDGDSLLGRAGLALNHQKTWNDGAGIVRSDIYGIGNLRYEFLDGTRARDGNVGLNINGIGNRLAWRRRILVELGEITEGIDNLAADDCQYCARVGDLILRAGEKLTIGYDDIGELADLDAAFFAFFIREPRHVRFFSAGCEALDPSTSFAQALFPQCIIGA